MIKQEKNKKELVRDLFQITKTIKTVYYELMISKINESKEEYQNAIKDLKLCLELENNIYKQLMPSLKSTFQDYEEIATIIQKNPDYHKDSLILERIEVYMTCYHFLNPFLSIHQNSVLQEEANTIAILNQYNMDLVKINDSLLEKMITNTKEQESKHQYIVRKFDCLFQYKAFELLILEKEQLKKSLLSGKENCLLFGQKEELIDKIFFQKSYLLLEITIQKLMKNPYDLNQEFDFLMLFAGLSLLNEVQLEKLYGSYIQNYLLKYHKDDIPPVLGGIMLMFQDLRENVKKKKKEKTF